MDDASRIGPRYSNQVIPYHDWYSHMWYRIGYGWI